MLNKDKKEKNYYNDKIAHIDNFLNWLKESEGKIKMEAERKEVLVIQCQLCQTKMNINHHCYGNKLTKERHRLTKDGCEIDLCHLCWDKNLEDAVKAAEY